jgi:hypothetical protein
MEEHRGQKFREAGNCAGVNHSIDPGVSGGLFLAEKRDGGTTGVVLSGVEVGEVFSSKKLKGLNRRAYMRFKSREIMPQA